jgi:hypothetical protein
MPITAKRAASGYSGSPVKGHPLSQALSAVDNAQCAHLEERGVFLTGVMAVAVAHNNACMGDAERSVHVGGEVFPTLSLRSRRPASSLASVKL